MKNKCNLKLVFGIISALIFVSCTDDEIVSTEKLELNKVLNFSYKTEIKLNNPLVATLTVPENKVWKIESASLYFDDYAEYPNNSALLLNQYILFQSDSDYGFVTIQPYLTQGEYKLYIDLQNFNLYNFGYSALSVLEYDIK